MHHDQNVLSEVLQKINLFLEVSLKLHLHPNKVSIETISSGIDFLGWIHFPNHRVLRTSTKRRMFKRLKLNPDNPQTISSYLGLIGHGNSKKLKNQIENLYGGVN